MAGKLFELVGSIMVESDAAQNSISETDKKAGGLAEKLSSGVGKAAAWGTAIAGGAAAAGAAVMKLANDAAGVADEIDKGSIRMGISTDQYQEFKYAAGQCGVEMTTLEKAAKKLEGTDINFDEAMASIMELGTAEERAAKASELFGETVAYQMSPLIEQSQESYDGLISRSHELGLVMSEESVAAGVTMGDTLADVKASIGMLGTSLGAELMPVVQTVLDWVVSNMPTIHQKVGEVFQFVKNLINDLKPFIQEITPIVQAVFEGIGKLWDSFLKPLLDGIITFISGVFTGNWEKAFSGIGKIVETVFDGVKNVFKGAINWIIDGFNKFTSGLGTLDIPDWVPIVGGKTLSFPQIPRLEKGGTVVDAGTVMVGERGPELLTLGQGAKVTPLTGSDNALSSKLDAVISIMEQFMPNIGTNIILDNGAIVGQMAPAMDRELGRLQKVKARTY